MPDHLSIEVFGVLRGSADGPLAVALLGTITLVAVIISIGRFVLKYAVARMTSANNRTQLTHRRSETASPHWRLQGSKMRARGPDKRLPGA